MYNGTHPALSNPNKSIWCTIWFQFIGRYFPLGFGCLCRMDFSKLCVKQNLSLHAPSSLQKAVENNEVTLQSNFLQNGNALSLSSQDLPSSPFTSFAVLLWRWSRPSSQPKWGNIWSAVSSSPGPLVQGRQGTPIPGSLQDQVLRSLEQLVEDVLALGRGWNSMIFKVLPTQNSFWI